jgi:hypothetical protein
LFSSSSFAPLLLRLRASVLCPAKTAAPCRASGCRCYCFRFRFGTGPGSLGPEGNGSFGKGTGPSVRERVPRRIEYRSTWTKRHLNSEWDGIWLARQRDRTHGNSGFPNWFRFCGA